MFYRHQLAFADDSLVEKMSVRRRVRYLFLAGLRGMLLAALEVFLSIFWVALYVTETYFKKTPHWITALNWTFVAIFSLLWLIHFGASADRLRFIVSVFSIIDYITIIPLFFASLGGVTFLRVISILRIFRLLRILLLAPNERVRKLLQISCILLCFVFVSTALVLVVEPDTFNDFWTSFYFVVVAIFTVGFGDVTPVTIFGQVVVTAIIICGVVLIPLQAFALSRILSVKRDTAAASYSHGHESKHIIIFGNWLYPSRMSEMITEFSIKYRFQRHIDLHIVIMQTLPPSLELRALEIPPVDGLPFIHVLHGSPLNFDDLQRASAKTAECAVTMFDNDHDTCLVHMALKSFNRSLAIFALLQRPEKAPLFRAVAPFKENHGEVLPTVLSRMEISGAMLARCIPTRGFATLICNLVRTRMVSLSAYEEEHTEYRRGAAYEIYFGVLPMTFCGSNFLDICVSIYSQHSALLIGLMTDGKHPLINPGSGYTIKGGELAIFLAPDASVTILIKDMQNLPLSMLPPDRPKRKLGAVRGRTKEEAGGVRPILGAESSTSTDVELQPLEPASRLTNAMSNDDSGSRPNSKSPQARRRKAGEEGIVAQDSRSNDNDKDGGSKKPGNKKRSLEQADARKQISWGMDNERNKLIRYHEVAKRVDILAKYYRVLDSPRTFRSAIIAQAPEEGHIILTGAALDWVYYVAPLRNRSVSKCQPIVIVTARPLTQKQWNSIAHFPEVYMMPGASLLKRRDIERLHVQGATHILITYGYADRLSHMSSAPTAAGSGFAPMGVSPQMLGASMSIGPSPDGGGDGDVLELDDDASTTFSGTAGFDATPASTRDAILIYSWLSRIFPKTRVIMDIKEESDLRFLHKAERSSDSHIQGEIRNGTACATSATVERLLAQTVYNPLVLDVVLQLIFGTRLASLPKASAATTTKRRGANDPLRKFNRMDLVEEDMDDANEVSDDDEDDEEEADFKPIIRLEQIPPHLKGASYRDLFEDLVQERDAMPIGLYRQLPRPNKTRKQQYVCTCPPADTPLEPGDRVYVLFPSVPKS